MITLTRDQAREVDRLAIEELSIPGIVLMENAGRNAAEIIRGVIGAGETDSDNGGAIVLCGGGNNGGDGYVIARHLHNHGVDVTVFTPTDPARLSGDAKVNHTICTKMRIPIRPIFTPQQLQSESERWVKSRVLVDALLGTGFQGNVREHTAAVIDRCNVWKTQCGDPSRDKKIVSIDVPSGLDCDTGDPSNATLRADVTITFLANKIGFTRDASIPYVGEVLVTDIGCPPGLIERVRSGRG